MHIAILSQFFYPEMGAPAARFLDFGKYFVRRGHRVTMLTAMPNFPSGRVHESYRGQLWGTETVEGVTVRRSWIYAPGKTGFRHKALGYLTFAATASANSVLLRERPDAIIATAPPPTLGIPALVASHWHRVPLVYDLRDLWPEALVNSERLQNQRVINALETVNRAVYRRASAVTTVSEGKRDRLIEMGVDASKIAVIPNGVDLGYFDDKAREHAGDAADIRRRAQFDPSSIVVTYAGLMNPPQGLDIVLDIAERCRGDAALSKLRFLLVGNGSERTRLEARAEGWGNVFFAGEQPRALIPAILQQSDATLVPLRPRKDTHTVPSKIFECLAASRPVLLSADGEPRRIIGDSGGGFATPSGDAEALIHSLRSLVRQSDRGRGIGASGRAYVERHYARDDLNARFLEVLQASIEGRSPRDITRREAEPPTPSLRTKAPVAAPRTTTSRTTNGTVAGPIGLVPPAY